jgi:hypothetical protein
MAWVLAGQCWRVFGVGSRALVGYTGALYCTVYVLNLFGGGWPGAPATCQHAIRAMVLKQGMVRYVLRRWLLCLCLGRCAFTLWRLGHTGSHSLTHLVTEITIQTHCELHTMHDIT